MTTVPPRKPTRKPRPRPRASGPVCATCGRPVAWMGHWKAPAWRHVGPYASDGHPPSPSAVQGELWPATKAEKP